MKLDLVSRLYLTRAAAVGVVVCGLISSVAFADPTNAPTTTVSNASPGRLIADRVYTAADDFVVDLYHNGKRVPDKDRKLRDEVYGATCEEINLTVRAGDWLVFNVVDDRLRWHGAFYFGAGGTRYGTVIGFVSELRSGQWSCCDDPSQVARFISDRDYLTNNFAHAIAHPFDRGAKEMQNMIHGWPGEGLWGTTANTWIKYRAPGPVPAKE